MKKKRHFRHGTAFTSLREAIEWIERRGNVYFRHKFMSFAWIENWSVAQLANAIRAGVLYHAENVTDTYGEGPK